LAWALTCLVSCSQAKSGCATLAKLKLKNRLRFIIALSIPISVSVNIFAALGP
jgi:hypothetical protein